MDLCLAIQPHRLAFILNNHEPVIIHNLTNKDMKDKVKNINKLLKAINAKNKGTQDTKSLTEEDI